MGRLVMIITGIYICSSTADISIAQEVPNPPNELSVTTIYEYGAETNQPTRVTTQTSDGYTIIKNYVYAHEIYAGMEMQHMLSQIYSVETSDDTGHKILCVKTEWKDLDPGANHKWAPDKEYEGCGSESQEIVDYLGYDQFGRIIEQRSTMGLTTRIFYGDVNNNFSNEASGLRNAYVTGVEKEINHWLGSQAHTIVHRASFDYHPLSGLISAIEDENGNYKSYIYDDANRLQEVRDASGQPVVQYEYNPFAYLYLGGNLLLDPSSIQASYPSGVPASPASVQTKFFDGLGREIQSHERVCDEVACDADVVSASEYDAVGRQWRQWRPYRQPNPSHAFRREYATEARDFYSGFDGNGTGTESKPYTQTTYYQVSPPRIEHIYAPGNEQSHDTYRYGIESPQNGVAPMSFTEAEDALGHRVRTYSDALGRERFVKAGVGTPEETLTETVYDAVGRIIEVRPPHYFAPPTGSVMEDWVTTYRYNTRGHLIESNTPDTDGAVLYRYDRGGRLRYRQDPRQRAFQEVEFYSYDELGRVWGFGVGHPSLPFAQLDPDGQGSGNPVPDLRRPDLPDMHWEWLGTNARTLYHYDDPTLTTSGGEIRIESWPFYGTPSFPYSNSLGQTVAVAHRMGPLWVSGGEWAVTFYAYDDEGRVEDRWVRVQGGAPVWERFDYDYDRQGRVSRESTSVAPYAFALYHDYDERGLPHRVYASTNGSKPPYPDGEYAYAADGAVSEARLGLSSSGSARVVPYQYDVRGRLIEIGDIEGPTQWSNAEPFAERLTYYGNNLIKEAEYLTPHAARDCLIAGYHANACAPRWRYSIAYDALGRLSNADYGPYGLTTWEHPYFTLHNLSYDKQGNLLELTRWAPALPGDVPFPGERHWLDHLTYTYVNGTNRLSSINEREGVGDWWLTIDWDAKPSTFTYDANGNVKSMTRTWGGESYVTAYANYDERNLPWRMHLPGRIQATYSYNEAGQRVRTLINTRQRPPPGETEPEYRLDRFVRDGDRLVGVFDGEGALQHWNIHGGPGNGHIGRIQVMNRLYVEFNQTTAKQTVVARGAAAIDSIMVSSLLQAGVPSVHVDTMMQSQTLISKVRDRLRDDAFAAIDSVSAHAVAEELNPFGRWHFQLSGYKAASLIEKALLQLGYSAVAADTLSADAGEFIAAQASMLTQGVVVDVRLAEVDPPPPLTYARRYYIGDHLRSVRAVISGAGQVIEARDYYPFGLQMPGRVYVSGSQTREGYTGHELDPETGHYYAGARYYMPALGRWTSVDPLADEFPELSPYNYALNNPLSYSDPTGESPVCQDEGNCDDIYDVGVVVSNKHGEWTYRGNNEWSFQEFLAPAGQGALAFAMAYIDRLDYGLDDKGAYYSTDPVTGDWYKYRDNYYGIAINHQGQNISLGAPVTGTLPPIGPGGGFAGLGRVINAQKQARHIVGPSYRAGRSILNANAQGLLSEVHAGRVVAAQQLPNGRYRVDFGRVIGEYISPAGTRLPTTKAIIHSGGSGVHIVPARP